ncbi:MAG: hypothetical protein R6V83_13410 [Candidatus Thorarchaeota archaeon]
MDYESIKNLAKLFVSAFVVTVMFILLYPFLGPYLLFSSLMNTPLGLFVMAFTTALVAVTLFSYANSRIGAADQRDRSFTEVDTSQLHRVVIDNLTGEEKVISGSQDVTFRSAAQKNWPFERIDKKSNWVIVDERGNDITDKKLSDYHEITRIQLKHETSG